MISCRSIFLLKYEITSFLANSSRSQIIILQRQPPRQRPSTARVRFNNAIVKAARKDKIGREVESEPFSKWRTKQLEKMKNQAAFPTQLVWYVRSILMYSTLISQTASIVCLNEFADDELVRNLDCVHAFHVDCLDEWYSRGHNQCPLCKSELCHSIATEGNSESQDES
jgi:hypothetical protein